MMALNMSLSIDGLAQCSTWSQTSSHQYHLLTIGLVVSEPIFENGLYVADPINR